MQNGINSSRIWNGMLRFNDVIIGNIEMCSMFKEVTKPYLLGETLQVDELISCAGCLEQEPICTLASSADVCKKLIENPCVEVKVRKLGTTQYFYTSYFTVSRQGSNAFTQLYSTLRRSQVIGLSILQSGAILLLIPNGDLSTLLTFPSHSDVPVFHCMMIVMGPKVDGLNVSNKMEPKENELVDSRSKTLALVAEFNAEWANEVHGSNSPNKLLDVPPSSSGYLGGASPNYPSSHLPTTGKTLTSRPTPYSRTDAQRSGSSNYRPAQFVTSGFSHGGQRERVHPASELSLSAGKDKNRALIQQTLQSVKNFGKDNTTSTADSTPLTLSDRPQASAIIKNQESGFNSSSSLPPAALLDPRIRRIATTDPRSLNKLLGLESPKPEGSSQSRPTTSNTFDNSPYSPSQTTRTMSPVSGLSNMSANNGMVIKPKITSGREKPSRTSAPVQIPLERIDANNTGNVTPSKFVAETPSKFFRDLSSISNDSINLFTGSFATSTPKVMDLHQSNAKTGLKFDILNWNAREQATNQRSTEIPDAGTMTSPASPSEPLKDTLGDETLIPLTKKPSVDDDEEDYPQLRIADDEDRESPQRKSSGDGAKLLHNTLDNNKAKNNDKDKDLVANTSDAMDMSMSDSDMRAEELEQDVISANGDKDDGDSKANVLKEGFGGRLSPHDIKVNLPPPGVVNSPHVTSSVGVPSSNTRSRLTLLTMPPPVHSIYGTMHPGYAIQPPAYPSMPTMYPDMEFFNRFINHWRPPVPNSVRPVSQVKPFMNGQVGGDDIDADKEKEFAQQAVSVLNRSPANTCAIPTEAIPIPPSAPAGVTVKSEIGIQNTSALESISSVSNHNNTSSTLQDAETPSFTPQTTIGIPFLPDDTDLSP